MRPSITRTTLSRPRPDRRVLWLMVLTALLLGLVGVGCVSQLALRILTPYGAIYPHSLLAMYGADYQPWNPGDGLALPPLNPQAALAAERDPGGGGGPNIAPVAVLPVGVVATDAPVALIQPTAVPSPTATAIRAVAVISPTSTATVAATSVPTRIPSSPPEHPEAPPTDTVVASPIAAPATPIV